MASSAAEYASSLFTLPTGSDNDLTNVIRGEQLNRAVQNKDPFVNFMGPDMAEQSDPESPPDAWYPFVKKTELEKGSGDQIIVPYVENLDYTLFKHGANALAATTSVQKIAFSGHRVFLVNSRTGAGYKNQAMSEQRNRHLSKATAEMLLTDVMAQRQAYEKMYALVNGYSSNVVAEVTSAAVISHPSANTFYGSPSATSDNAVTNTDTLTWKLMQRMENWIIKNNIKPCKMENGETGYVLFVPPYSIYDLGRDADWISAQNNAFNSKGYESPIFKTAEGRGPGNIFVHATNYTQNPASTVGDYTKKWYCILMGSHALSCAYGKSPQIFPNLNNDFFNLAEWSIDAIFGFARTERVSDDGNTTYTNQSSSRWTVWAEDPNAAP